MQAQARPAGEGRAGTAVLVVIPTLNEAATIEGVIDALFVDLPGTAAVSFVVVDGGSSDGTVQIVERLRSTRPQLALLHNPRRIQSAAVNLAARSPAGCAAQVLIRCDAHASYPPGFVRRLLESLARTGADAVVVPMDSSGGSSGDSSGTHGKGACLQRAVAWVSDTPAGSGGSAHRGGTRSSFVDHGHHAAFRSSSFRRAGGYDESFTHNEDAELDCRQAALGARIWLDADIRVGYHPRGTLAGLWRQYRAYGAGRARTVRRHPGSMRARQFAVPAHFAVTLLALLIAPWWPWLLLWPAAYGLALGAVSVQLVVKHRSACALLAGVAAAVMHTAWAAGFFWSMAATRERPWRPSAAAPFKTAR